MKLRNKGVEMVIPNFRPIIVYKITSDANE